MTEVEQLKREIFERRERLHEIENLKRAEENKLFVGKHFVYCNSCPQRPEDYWNLYTKVTHMDEYGTLHGIRFQTDTDGKVTIETTAVGPSSVGEFLSEREFQEAWAETLKRVQTTLQLPE